MKIYIGIDPGAKGAMVCMFTPGSIHFLDYAVGGIHEYIKHLKLIQKTNPTADLVVGVEKVHSMPGQGVVATFSFGYKSGELAGMLAALRIPNIQVTPIQWQRVCKKKPKSNKKGTFDAIKMIYPSVIDELTGPKGGIKDGRCDALGLMHYVRTKY